MEKSQRLRLLTVFLPSNLQTLPLLSYQDFHQVQLPHKEILIATLFSGILCNHQISLSIKMIVGRSHVFISRSENFVSKHMLLSQMPSQLNEMTEMWNANRTMSWYKHKLSAQMLFRNASQTKLFGAWSYKHTPEPELATLLGFWSSNRGWFALVM